MIKSKNSGRKITTIAVMATAVLLIAATITLVISSVVFAKNNGEDDQRDKNNEAPAPEIEYTVVESIRDELSNLGEMVKVKDKRTAHPNGGANQYYASYNVSVPSTVQKSLDAMLVANYNANKSSMVSDTSIGDCNIPVVKSAAAGGTSVTILTYDDENNKPYTTAWLTNNAAKYGFVQNGSSFVYVGIPHAAYMAKSGVMSISSYVSVLSNGSVKISAADVLTGATASYEIYHIASGAELSVPANFAYTAISDGNGGYIVAVNLSKPTGSAGQ